MCALLAQDVSVFYPGQPMPALSQVNLSLGEASLTVALGPSGCGKTTLLNVLAGFIAPSQGRVTLDGQPVTGPGADRAVVFQHDALLPWLNVRDNVAFGLQLQGVGRAERQRRADDMLALVGLDAVAKQKIWALSGGMRQRVGIARALTSPSQVLLMDEPFGALDALTRAHLQDELMRIVQATGSTVVMVTHDVDEAVLLSDRIVMMTNGPAATVGEILSVTLARPRDRLALANDPEYHRYRSAVLEFLYHKELRPAA